LKSRPPTHLEPYNNTRKRLKDNNFWENLFLGPQTKVLYNKTETKLEKRIKKKTIDQDSLIKIPAGINHSGILVVRKESFSPHFTIKIVDKQNQRPLYFELGCK